MPFTPSYDVPEERRAYTLKAGPVGCLMLHGFLGSPTSSRPMAEFLAERGVTVHCPLLPGHGELPNKLYQVSSQAWMDEAMEALGYLQQYCDEIVLMGHSMGSVLCAHLASQISGLRGLIMLAPAYDVPSKAIHLMPVLRHIIPWFNPLRLKKLHGLVRDRLHDFDPTIDFDDPAVQARLPAMSRVPTSGIDEMRKVVLGGHKLWPQVDLPSLIFQGDHDIAVKPEDTHKLYEVLPNDDKKLVLLKGAGHELMRPFDPAHKEVWARVSTFFHDHTTLEEPSPSMLQEGA